MVGLLSSSSTDALDPATLLSWAFLCIAGCQQHPWLLPTHQVAVMHAHLWPTNPSDSAHCPVGVRTSVPTPSCGFFCQHPDNISMWSSSAFKDPRLYLDVQPGLSWSYLCSTSAQDLASVRLSGLKPSYSVQVWPLRVAAVTFCSLLFYFILFFFIGEQGESCL